MSNLRLPLVSPTGTNKAASSAGAATTLTFAAPGANLRNIFAGGVWFGFHSTPAATCYFTVTVNGVETHRIPVTAAGAGFFPFAGVAAALPNQAVVFGLTGDGGTAIGYLACAQHGIESV
jgi:hypothetical protein